MRYHFSGGLTTELDEPFAGASLTNCMALYYPKSLPTLTAVDVSDQGRVTFRTSVEVTSKRPADMPPQAAYRLACMYLLGHLTEDGLREACRSLFDIREFHGLKDQDKSAPAIAPALQAARKAVVTRRVQSQPFEIAD